jgi:putative acetyltransferase
VPNAGAPIVVRPAAEADLDAMVALLALVAAEDRWIATQAPFDAELRRSRMRERMQRGDSQSFVAVAGDAHVGNLDMSLRRRGVYEFGMVVANERRGQGVGSALLDASITWAREAGAHKIVLEVFPQNAPAIALYRKFGFIEEGYLRRHLRRNDGALWDVIAMGLLLDETSP